MKREFTEAQLMELLSGEDLSDDLLRLIEASPSHRAEAIRLLSTLGIAIESAVAPERPVTLSSASVEVKPSTKLMGSPWRDDNGVSILMEEIRVSFGPDRQLRSSGLDPWAVVVQREGIGLGGTDLAGDSGVKKWAIPLPELNCTLQFSLSPLEPAASGAGNAWKLQLALECPPGSPDLSQKISLTLGVEGGLPSIECRLADIAGNPIELKEGAWLLRLESGSAKHEIPFRIGA